MDEPYVTQRPVRVVEEALICGCGQPMRPTGFIVSTVPVTYPHECKNGHVTEPHPPFTYPRINHVAQDIELEPFCTCPEGPKLGKRQDWVKPRCGRCYLFVREDVHASTNPCGHLGCYPKRCVWKDEEPPASGIARGAVGTGGEAID